MSTPFQNRLVGTIIVVAAAIIFLPDMLDGQQKVYRSQFENIPKAPEITAKQQEKSFPTEQLDKLKSKDKLSDEVALDDLIDKLDKENSTGAGSAETNSIASTLKTNVAEAATVNDQSKLQQTDVSQTEQVQENNETDTIDNTKAWVIQLGSFRNQTNVSALIQKLKSNGYTVFSRRITTASGVLTSIFIGPAIEKGQLEGKIIPLEKLTNVKGKVVAFTVD